MLHTIHVIVVVHTIHAIIVAVQEVQIFTNAALMALAENFTIQKFMTLSSHNQHVMKIYRSSSPHHATSYHLHDRDPHYRVSVHY